MSIKNREDANKYYQEINKLIDNYMDKWKIKPSNLKRYLKYGSDKYEKFIDRNGLRDVEGIRRVINDVIDDRVHMEEDGILTFENFKLFESDDFKITSILQCLYKGVGKADIKAEKFLADYYDTTLSKIEIVNSDKHIFKISNWEKDDLMLIVYNTDEFEIIKENIKEYLLTELVSKEVDLVGISVKLSSIIDNEKFKNVITDELDDEKITELINKSLENNYTDFNFTKTDDFYIWSKKD